jgi:uncharacterized protein YndB with AHSA1/START domain
VTTTADNGWELSVTRFIDAPPEKVWDIMTNRIGEWWCPKPWRAEFDRLDRRAGGASMCTMYGPDGEVHPHPGTVLAWDEGRRFAFTDAVVGDLMPAGPFMIGIWVGRGRRRWHALYRALPPLDRRRLQAPRRNGL